MDYAVNPVVFSIQIMHSRVLLKVVRLLVGKHYFICLALVVSIFSEDSSESVNFHRSEEIIDGLKKKKRWRKYINIK